MGCGMRWVWVVLSVQLLAGCAAGDRVALGTPAVDGLAITSAEPAGRSAADQTCAAVASHSTTVGEAFTRSLADEAVVYRIAESRGQLMQQGLRRVRVAERRTSCEKHLYLGPGMQEYHCVARARICGS